MLTMSLLIYKSTIITALVPRQNVDTTAMVLDTLTLPAMDLNSQPSGNLHRPTNPLSCTPSIT